MTSDQSAIPPGRSDIGVILRLLSLAGQHRNYLLYGFLLRLLQSICLGASLAVVLWVISMLAENSVPSGSMIWTASLLMALSFIGQISFGIMSMRVCWMVSHRVGGDVRLAMLERLRNLPMSFHLSCDKGDITTALTSDIQMLETFLADGFPRIANALGLPLVALFLLGVTDWRAALVGILSIACASPLLLWSSRRLVALSAVRSAMQADAATQMIEFVQGMKVIRAFNRVSDGWGSFRIALARFHAISLEMITALVAPVVTFSACVMLGLPLLITFVGYRYFGGELNSASVIISLGLMTALYSPILSLMGVTETARTAESALRRIDRIFDAFPLVEPVLPNRPKGFDIAIEDVSFSYVPGARVLHGVSLYVPERSMTAIVGPSGSGKTTLLNLLARFWDVEHGRVMLGGVDVRDMRFEDVAARIAVVFQDVYLFSGTIASNIAAGRPGASYEEVEAAARKAQAHDFIMAMPDGYASRVGEGGATLSGGERQRISIARAILKDAPIVLLDEATAAIDPTNEYAIQTALGRLVENRTVIVVAHRLSTIRSADQIIVLEQGRVVETGQHEVLLSKDGLYARLWRLRSEASSWQMAG